MGSWIRGYPVTILLEVPWPTCSGFCLWGAWIACRRLAVCAGGSLAVPPRDDGCGKGLSSRSSSPTRQHTAERLAMMLRVPYLAAVLQVEVRMPEQSS